MRTFISVSEEVEMIDGLVQPVVGETALWCAIAHGQRQGRSRVRTLGGSWLSHLHARET